MSDKKVEFIPFHALNEFMRPDFRFTVVRAALAVLPKLPAHFRAPIDKLTKKVVRVPGFRDGTAAPPSMKVAPIAEAFGKSPELVSAVIAAWAEAQTDLRAKVYDLLNARGWELLPADADRTKLPGFLTAWPKGEDFDVINKAYAEAHPGEETSTDDVSLMAVWLSGRLPVNTEPEDEDASEAESETS
jgi:hypothetical protein